MMTVMMIESEVACDVKRKYSVHVTKKITAHFDHKQYSSGPLTYFVGNSAIFRITLN